MKNNIYNDILTVVVPTHNRIDLLYRCISSIKHIFPTIKIIIGDNSSTDYPDITMFNNDSSITVINTRKHEGNIYIAYKSIIEKSKTKYTLIVEDDDMLINAKLHYRIIDIIKNNTAVISFAGITDTNEKTLYNKYSGNFFNIPSFWNGEFQFGLCYYPTNELLHAINKWFNYDPVNIIDGTFDEAIALLTIQNIKKYYHIPEIGERIYTNTNNMSWNNPKHRIFSHCKYIDHLTQLLHMSNKWNLIYK